MAKNRFQVNLQPVGRRVDIEPGRSILDASRSAGVGLVSLCGGEGWCDSCLVRIASGTLNPPSQSEVDSLGEQLISEGYRLACQAIPESDVRVDIPPESLSTPQRLQIEGKDFDIPINPVVQVMDLKLTPPSLVDLRADADRVLDALVEEGYSKAKVAYPILVELSGLIREFKWAARFVLRESEVIGVLPAGMDIYGLAVDIGTTKLALYLVNLLSGEICEKTGEMNPQIAYGEDVISRIDYANENTDGRQELQGVLVEVLNNKIQELCDSFDIKQDQIMDAVFVGNTAMHHLFAGLPVEQLVFAPYVPALNESLDIRAKDIGIQIAVGAYLHLLPNIAGYVGADHSAVILSTDLRGTNDTVMAIDIGTNTEISLVYNGRILSCSCASGPAFEGAHISHGMRAAPGAIERVQFIDNEIKIFTIEDQPPVGICGSGIVDVVAEMKSAELMNEKGAFIEDQQYMRQDKNKKLEFLLVPKKDSGNKQDITVSRKDVNEIQLAKAAIKAGQDILLAEAGIKAEDLDRVLVAGAFGTYINVPNAIKIGMFQDIPPDRFHQVGNAAGMGAIQALLSKEQRNNIEDIIKDVEYIELTTWENFQDVFVKGMYLK
jgi:uncharacterized 2Fe-2S/4Fe-4S cluster protein (DUF4445 family)